MHDVGDKFSNLRCQLRITFDTTCREELIEPTLLLHKLQLQRAVVVVVVVVVVTVTVALFYFCGGNITHEQTVYTKKTVGYRCKFRHHYCL